MHLVSLFLLPRFLIQFGNCLGGGTILNHYTEAVWCLCAYYLTQRAGGMHGSAHIISAGFGDPDVAAAAAPPSWQLISADGLTVLRKASAGTENERFPNTRPVTANILLNKQWKLI